MAHCRAIRRLPDRQARAIMARLMHNRKTPMALRLAAAVLITLWAAIAGPGAAPAQDNAAPPGKAWVQVSSHQELADAIATAERFARDFQFTRVFLAASGWYAVALGVVDSARAEEVLSALIRRGRIPRDSLTTDGRDYLTEVWSAKRAAASGSGLDPALAAAIAAEERLSEAERRAVQEALLWTGDYLDAIDGRFGPRTRAAIRAFQARSGAAVTGFLAPGDLDALFAARDGTLRRIGWRIVEDGPRGIRVGLAAALFGPPVEIDAGLRLEGRGPAAGALLSLLSLSGGRRMMESMIDSARRSLDPGAEVERGPNRVSILGRNGGRIIHTHLERRGDAVRGFILSFGEDAAPLMLPVAVAMRHSFAPRPVADGPLLAEEMNSAPPPAERAPRPRLSPTPAPAATSGSGMVGDRTDPRPPPRERVDREPAPRPDPRRPRPRSDEEPRRDRPGIRRDDRDVDSTGTGFYVSTDGKILTNHHVVAGCRRMIVDGRDDARVIATDADSDLALLQHRTTRDPDAVARFSASPPRLNSDVTVVGYPLYGLLGGLNVTRGVISSLAGLRGDPTFIQISAEVQPGNSGGPALDAQGRVVGVVQSKLDALRLSERLGDIPQNINFAIRAEVAAEFLRAQGVSPLVGEARAPLEPADLAEAAQKFTVLLECVR
ncbi:MAG: hypothetical protein KatS3mg118_1911 [Paracoccaceae bacterium]|nr:MAG: hypothetical protein KatS3mg118_1911 [Paracoccaceae bacterium]